jgi:hypothetical protein
MNRKQWSVLSWSFMLLGAFFITLDINHGFIFSDDACLKMQISNNDITKGILERIESGEITNEKGLNMLDEFRRLDQYDILCVVRGEIYAPFVWLSSALWIIFMICGFLEPKNK